MAVPFGEEGAVGDRWRERVARGALRWPDRVPVILGHSNSAPLGVATLRETPTGVAIDADIPDAHPMTEHIRELGPDRWGWSIGLHPEGMKRSGPQLVDGVSRTVLTAGRILHVGLLMRGTQVYAGAVVEAIE